MLLSRPVQEWLKTGIALTEDSRCPLLLRHLTMDIYYDSQMTQGGNNLSKSGSMCLLSFHYLTMDTYYVSYNSWSFSFLLFNWSQKPRSRLGGSKPQTSKLLTLNVFLNYYSDYDNNGDTGFRIFNEWIKLV